MKKLTRDMTEGSAAKHILAFTLPMLLGIVFQQFYSMVDSMVVGKWIGVEAIAGVGSTGSINFMIIGFCNGLGTGFAIPVARAFGAKDYSLLRKYVANALWLSIALCTVITALVTVYCREILVFMQTPEDIMGYAYTYIVIIFAGIPILYAYNLLAAILRALGDSKTPVYFLIIAALLNVVLDVISVVFLKMGVEGPALATLISQLVSAVLCFIYMVKKFDILKIKGEEWLPSKTRMVTLASMGLPMGLQYSITAIGSVVIQTAVNTIGTAAVAAVAAGNKIAGLVVCPYDAMGSTMATFVGQNAGVGNHKRIKQGVAAAMIIGCIYSVFSFGVLALFGKQIGLWFIDAGEAAILDDVHLFLIINSATYVLLLAVNVLRFSIQGMGFSFLAIIAGVLEMIGRSLIALVFVPRFGFVAACFANSAAWVFADLFLIPAFFLCCRRLKRMVNENRLRV